MHSSDVNKKIWIENEGKILKKLRFLYFINLLYRAESGSVVISSVSYNTHG